LSVLFECWRIVYILFKHIRQLFTKQTLFALAPAKLTKERAP